MTKADLVEIVAERTGFTKSDVHVICDTLLDTIKEVMSEGNNIAVSYTHLTLPTILLV